MREKEEKRNTAREMGTDRRGDTWSSVCSQSSSSFLSSLFAVKRHGRDSGRRKQGSRALSCRAENMGTRETPLLREKEGERKEGENCVITRCENAVWCDEAV